MKWPPAFEQVISFSLVFSVCNNLIKDMSLKFKEFFSGTDINQIS